MLQLTAVELIGPIIAVNASVAPPAARDALPIRALKLADAAFSCWFFPATGLRPLVRSIGTVLVPVTAPQGRHAHRVVALERQRVTSGLGTGRLVGTI